MKLCTATFPILFFNKKTEAIKDFFRPHYVEVSEITVEISFEIDQGTNLFDEIKDFIDTYKGVPMEFWQEEDVGGYDFSAGQDIYVLPSGETVVVNCDEVYDVIPISALEKITNMEDLAILITDEKKKNPTPNMKQYYIAYNTKKFDDRFPKALHKLSDAFDEVSQLCSEGNLGDEFNQEILAEKLGHLWVKSLDEIAWDIEKVAKELE